MKAKIYTKTGDAGETFLRNGTRVLKNNLRVSAYGSLDELNSLLGIVIAKINDKRVELFINQIQKDLLLIGAHLAGEKGELENLKIRVREMEKVIDELEEKLPPLKNFILPEGIEVATFLYFARAVARRAERELVALNVQETVDKNILIYMNRLSDFLFILARYLNFKAGIAETIWEKNKMN